jgi:hypothetical protein
VQESIGYTFVSLVFYLQVCAPEVSLCLYWLARQRALLSERWFRSLLRLAVGREVAQTILQLLNEKRTTSGEAWRRIPPLLFALDVSLGCLTERNDDVDV